MLSSSSCQLIHPNCTSKLIIHNKSLPQKSLAKRSHIGNCSVMKNSKLLVRSTIMMMNLLQVITQVLIPFHFYVVK